MPQQLDVMVLAVDKHGLLWENAQLHETNGVANTAFYHCRHGFCMTFASPLVDRKVLVPMWCD
jgi:hypothetical protein